VDGRKQKGARGVGQKKSIQFLEFGKGGPRRGVADFSRENVGLSIAGKGGMGGKRPFWEFDTGAEKEERRQNTL